MRTMPLDEGTIPDDLGSAMTAHGDKSRCGLLKGWCCCPFEEDVCRCDDGVLHCLWLQLPCLIRWVGSSGLGGGNSTLITAKATAKSGQRA